MNALGVGAIVYSRLTPSSKDSSPPQPPADRRLPSPEIPPRPTPPALSNPSAVQSEVSRLRSLAFDAAEFTVRRLDASPGALCLLGKLHLRTGNVDGARLLWDQAIARDADFAEAYLDYGHLELKRGNAEAAEKFFRKALAKDRTLLAAYSPLAEALLAQGKFTDTVTYLSEFLSLRPQSVKVWCQLGQAHQELAQFDQAEHCYSKALQIDATSREAVSGMMSVFRSQGDRPNADRYAEQFAKLDASFQRVADDRKSVTLDLIKMRDLATYAFQTAAGLLAGAGDISSAIAQLETGNEALPESREIASQLANQYAGLGRYDQAIKLLRQQCDQSPDDSRAWMELATFCLQCRRFDAAEAALRQLLKLTPENAQAYVLLSQTQMPANRDPQAAVASARRAVELSATAGNHYVLATALYHGGDLQAAEAELNKAIALEPDNTEFRSALSAIRQ